MRSIQKHLSFGLVSILLVIGLLFAHISLFLFDQGLRRYLENNLHQQSQHLLGALTRTEGIIELDQLRTPAVFDRPFSGHYFLINIPDKNWRSRSSWDYSLSMPTTKALQEKLIDGPQEQKLLVYRADYRRFGKKIRIVVAQDYTPMLESFRRVQTIGIGLGVGALLLLLLLQRFIVKRALRPLDNIRTQIAQLQQGQRSTLDTVVPDELVPLVEQINHLLIHTEITLKRSRNALGNLGHALKTPLAILFSIGSRNELDKHPELKNNLRTQLLFIQERLGRELGRARLAGDVLPGAHFDCAQELPDLFTTLTQIHQRNLKLEWSAPENLRLPWDREDMLELLGNLLDNACKWATSIVDLRIETSSSHFILLIDDDGPGIETEQHQKVLNRGIRIDEQIEGHGLGLGIVRDIVAHCEGQLLLQQSPLGGLRVAIHLPVPT